MESLTTRLTREYLTTRPLEHVVRLAHQPTENAFQRLWARYAVDELKRRAGEMRALAALGALEAPPAGFGEDTLKWRMEG